MMIPMVRALILLKVAYFPFECDVVGQGVSSMLNIIYIYSVAFVASCIHPFDVDGAGVFSQGAGVDHRLHCRCARPEHQKSVKITAAQRVTALNALFCTCTLALHVITWMICTLSLVEVMRISPASTWKSYVFLLRSQNWVLKWRPTACPATPWRTAPYCCGRRFGFEDLEGTLKSFESELGALWYACDMSRDMICLLLFESMFDTVYISQELKTLHLHLNLAQAYTSLPILIWTRTQSWKRLGLSQDDVGYDITSKAGWIHLLNLPQSVWLMKVFWMQMFQSRMFVSVDAFLWLVGPIRSSWCLSVSAMLQWCHEGKAEVLLSRSAFQCEEEATSLP